MERNLLERDDDDLLIEEGEENGLTLRREAIEGGPEKGGSCGRHAARIGNGRAANVARPERTNDVRAVVVPARDTDKAGEKTAMKKLGGRRESAAATGWEEGCRILNYRPSARRNLGAQIIGVEENSEFWVRSCCTTRTIVRCCGNRPIANRR